MNVLFDLDGTLTDPAPGITACLRHALATVNRPVGDEEVLDHFIGPPLLETLKALLGPDDPELISAALVAYRERFSSVGLYENAVYPGIAELLDTLSAGGHRLYVATSKPTIYAVRIVEHFGLRDHFYAVYGSELDGTRSDKGDLIAHLLACEGLSPADTVMIGDRAQDMIGGAQHGLRTIGVLWGYGSADEFAGATWTCAAPAAVAVLCETS